LNPIRILTSAKPATENTDFVEGGRWVNFCDAARMYNSVLTEGGGAKKMVDRLAIHGEAGLAITDHYLAIGVDAQEVTHVTLF
jgi:hypothetical protein